jgi:hypothetical protein
VLSRSRRASRHRFGRALIVVVLGLLGLAAADPPKPPPPARVAVPAAPAVTAEIARLVETARQRFEARDVAGVLAHVSEQYRSAGFTKAAVRQQILAMFGLYQEMRARVRLDAVEVVDGATWLYTTGELSGRLPLMGWMTVLAWQREPEVVRREGADLRLFGFQD